MYFQPNCCIFLKVLKNPERSTVYEKKIQSNQANILLDLVKQVSELLLVNKSRTCRKMKNNFHKIFGSLLHNFAVGVAVIAELSCSSIKSDLRPLPCGKVPGALVLPRTIQLDSNA